MIRSPAYAVPFVDREGEMRTLDGLARDVLEGNGRTVLVAGEAGVGKSRLVMEFASRAESRGFILLTCQCLYHSDADPYLPFIDALKRLSTESTADAAHPLGFVPVEGTGNDVPLVLTGLEHRPELPETGTLEDEKKRMFNRIVSTLQAASRKNPLILFIDDLQWADNASLQLFHYLARNAGTLRLLLVASYRPEDLQISGAMHPVSDLLLRMSRERIADQVTISRLSFEDVKQMVLMMLNVRKLPQRFLRFVYEETEGNPLFVEETIRDMVEQHLIDTSKLSWELHVDLDTIKVPATIRDLITRRISALMPEERKVLMYASVIGNSFDYDLLKAASEFDESTLLDALDRLLTLRLIREVRDAGSETYQFDHFQVRAVMYESLSQSRRRFIHRKVGELIEARYRGHEEEHAFALARHFTRGGDPVRGLKYTLMAGERAMRTLALNEAVEYFSNAAEILRGMPLTPENDALALRVYRTLGRLANDQGRFTEALGHYQNVLSVTERTGDRESHAFALIKTGHILIRQGKIEQARDAFARGLEIAREVGADALSIDALRGLGYMHWRMGEPDRAIERYSEAMRVCDDLKDEHLRGIIFIDIGNAYNYKGDLDRAEEYYNLSMESLKRLNDTYEANRAMNNLGDVYLQREEWSKAVEIFEELISSAEAIGDKNRMGWAMFNVSEALVNLGEHERADEHLRTALAVVSSEDDAVGVAACHRIRGLLHFKKGEYPQAVEELNVSIDLLDRAKIPFEAGMALVNLAHVHRAMGDLEKARSALTKARGIMERVGSERYLKKIDDLMRQIP